MGINTKQPKAAFEGIAFVKSGCAILQEDRIDLFYDYFATGRSFGSGYGRLSGSGHATVKTEFHIGGLNQFLLGSPDPLDHVSDVFGVTVLIGQFQIALEMPCFTFEQAEIKLAKFFV